MSTAMKTNPVVNGIDTAKLKRLAGDVAADARNGVVGFDVRTEWLGGTRSETRVSGYELGGRRIARQFTIGSDEPVELCGENTEPNPQELLMAAFNACMMVGYVAGAALNGVTLESVSIETEGRLDLRGFLGLDAGVKPGYEEIRYTVRIKGDGTREQFQKIHETVMATSPNRWNVENPIKLTAALVVE